MTTTIDYQGATAICAIIAIAFFKIGQAAERWKSRRHSDAAERIRRKYQAYKDDERV